MPCADRRSLGQHQRRRRRRASPRAPPARRRGRRRRDRRASSPVLVPHAALAAATARSAAVERRRAPSSRASRTAASIASTSPSGTSSARRTCAAMPGGRAPPSPRARARSAADRPPPPLSPSRRLSVWTSSIRPSSPAALRRRPAGRPASRRASAASSRGSSGRKPGVSPASLGKAAEQGLAEAVDRLDAQAAARRIEHAREQRARAARPPSSSCGSPSANRSLRERLRLQPHPHAPAARGCARAISAAPALVKVRHRIASGAVPREQQPQHARAQHMRLAGAGRGGQPDQLAPDRRRAAAAPCQRDEAACGRHRAIAAAIPFVQPHQLVIVAIRRMFGVELGGERLAAGQPLRRRLVEHARRRGATKSSAVDPVAVPRSRPGWRHGRAAPFAAASDQYSNARGVPA